jgi:hypothetical protein
MAIAFKSIPTLQDKAAESFVKKADASAKEKGTIDFSKQVKSATSILAKAQLK